MTVQADPAYVFERSVDEYQRLTQQAALFEPMTERLFRDAGVTSGMRVLDLGSGVGDVAFLAARIVGRRARTAEPTAATQPDRGEA